MIRSRWCAGLIILRLVASAGFARAESPTAIPPGDVQAGDKSLSLFDPARHMAVSEVREGMKGYGLSVFKGTTIERFEVKVVSVLRSPFVPRNDVVLVECAGKNLEHTGIAQGMSGSPVFLEDGTGKSRMIGAVAFGWPMTKDAIAGVQPIEYMLKIPTVKGAATGAPARAEGDVKQRIRWSIEDARVELLGGRIASRDDGVARRDASAGRWPAANRSMTVLAAPMATSGVPRSVLKNYGPLFEKWGMVPLEASVSGKSAVGAAEIDAIRFEPGSVMAIPMLTGDIESSVFGTCTEVIGDRVFGFGHPFTNEGPVEFPLATGSIASVIANVQTSFKIGSLARIKGSVLADQQVGAAGRIGAAPPPMVPMEVTIAYADGSVKQTYKVNLISDPKMTGAAAAMAIQAAITGVQELPQFHTVEYDLKLEFANGQILSLVNTLVNAHGAEMVTEVGLPIAAAADNPFQRVMLSRITGKVTVTPKARQARILSVNLAKTKFQPGDIAKLFVTYRPFRGEEKVMPIEFEIPRELADGVYQLSVADWDTFLEQEKLARPFRFTAETVDEVFAVLKEGAAVRHDAVYVRLLRQADGVAIGRTAMPRLPSSRRQVLLGAGLSNTSQFVSSTVKTVPTDLVMDGAAAFPITVSRDAKVEGAGGAKTPPKHEVPKGASGASPADAKAKGATKIDIKPDAVE